MYKKNSASCVRYIFAVLLVLIFLLPFFIMIIRSFMSEEEIFDFPKLLPSHIVISNYYNAAIMPKILGWLFNTMTVAVLSIIGTLVSAFLCAYGFAKVHFKFKSLIFAITMASTMLPNITMRIPLYMIYSDWGWLDGTLKPLFVPAYLGGGALNILLIMQFIKGIPNSVLESARIDGANELHCLFKIVLPNCLPIATLICVNTFLSVWNEYSSALTFLSNSEEKWTLALGLYKLSIGYYDDPVEGLIFRENQQMALGVLMCIPSMLLFGFFQKSLIEGVA
ncbi:MAG: carbohydrate ABC transporter permease, partial [Clostridia bacterium]|nr:carbohydrate ABC transporter permease [Clostridia bacterium]